MENRLIEEKIKAEVDYFKLISPGYKRARAFHKKIQMIQDSWRLKNADVYSKLSCNNGCSHCCNGLVQITEDEADLLAEVYSMAHKNGFEIDLEQLKKQSNWLDDRVAWLKKPKNERKCVFLDTDGKCRVYEYRPAVCRNMLTTTNEEVCERAGNGENVKIKSIKILGTLAVAAASSRLAIKPENLAKKLHRRLNG